MPRGASVPLAPLRPAVLAVAVAAAAVLTCTFLCLLCAPRYPTAPGEGGLFAVFARFNHACTPNVTHRFEEGLRRVFAARDIERGEELLNSYVPPEQSRTKR
jgi:hypothetical protein